MRAECDREVEAESAASITPLDKSKKNSAEAQIDECRQKISTLKATKTDMQTQVKDREQELAQNKDEVGKFLADIAALESSGKTLERECESLQQEVKEKRELFLQSEQTYLSLCKEHEDVKKDLEQGSNRQNNLKQSLDGFGETSNTLCNTVDKMRKGCHDLRVEIEKIQGQIDGQGEGEGEGEGGLAAGSPLPSTGKNIHDIIIQLQSLRDKSSFSADHMSAKTGELKCISDQAASLKKEIAASRSEVSKLEVELRICKHALSYGGEISPKKPSTGTVSPDSPTLTDPAAKESAAKVSKHIADLKKDITKSEKLKTGLQRKIDLRKKEVSALRDEVLRQNKKNIEVQTLSTNYGIAKMEHEDALRGLRSALEKADEKFRADLKVVEKGGREETGGVMRKGSGMSKASLSMRPSADENKAPETVSDSFTGGTNYLPASVRRMNKTRDDAWAVQSGPPSKTKKPLKKKGRQSTFPGSSVLPTQQGNATFATAPKKDRTEEKVKKRSSILPRLKLRQTWEDEDSDILVPSSQPSSQQH